MLKVKNKLNVINYVCGVEIKPFGVKYIDVDIGNEEIQSKIKCNSIMVVEIYNQDISVNNTDVVETYDVVNTNVKKTRRRKNKNEN